MKKKTITVFAVLIFLIPSAVIYGERIELVTDQYWHEMIIRENSYNPVLELRQSVLDFLPFINSNSVFINKKRIKTSVLEVQGRSADYQMLSNAVLQVKGSVVILSPLLAYDACRIAEENPEKEIIAINLAARQECAAANCSYLELSRNNAFIEAGAWAAGQETEVFVLFFTGYKQAEAEIASFNDGWKTAAGGSGLHLTKIRDTADTLIVDEWIDKIETSEGCVAAVFAGPMTVTVLDRLEGLSCRILSEHIGLWPDSRYPTAGSIELGPVKILSEAVNYSNAGSYGENAVIQAEFILFDF